MKYKKKINSSPTDSILTGRTYGALPVMALSRYGSKHWLQTVDSDGVNSI